MISTTGNADIDTATAEIAIVVRADPEDSFIGVGAYDQDEEPPVEDYDPGPECDDQGGMSEYHADHAL